MEPYAAFTRIDRGLDGFVSSMDLLNYLRDNNVYDITEADCYYLIKFFDSDEDGKLNFPDFMQMILPCDNTYLRSVATQRPNQIIHPTDYLTLDVEADLTKLILSEIQLHKKSESMKQELESLPDYSTEGVYTAIDDWGYGFVDQRNLGGFLKKNKLAFIEDECIAIIRRLDLDADSKLTKEEYQEGIRAQEPYSKMIVRERLHKKDFKARSK